MGTREKPEGGRGGARPCGRRAAVPLAEGDTVDAPYPP